MSEVRTITPEELRMAFRQAIKNLERYAKSVGVDLEPEPQLIQGYTAENWQEIIDGGYLCEAKDVSTREWVPVILKRMDTDDDSHPFKIKYSASSAVKDDEDHDWQEFCRPAQIKGVMRPIFVEPVDKDAGYVFFDRRGSYLGTSNFFTGATWNETIGCCMSSDCTPTKYIEL